MLLLAPQNARDAFRVDLVSRAANEVALGTASAVIRESRILSTRGTRACKSAEARPLRLGKQVRLWWADWAHTIHCVRMRAPFCVIEGPSLSSVCTHDGVLLLFPQ